MGMGKILGGIGAGVGAALAVPTGGASLGLTAASGILTGAAQGASLGQFAGSLFEGSGGRPPSIAGQPALPQGTNLASSTPSFDFGQGGQTIAPRPGVIGQTIAQPHEDPFLAALRKRIGVPPDQISELLRRRV